MRRLLAALAALAALALAPMAAWGQTGLAGSPHDFTLTVGATAVPNAGTDADGNPISEVGLCTFCHTPHRAQQTKLLWNHTLSANTFSWSDATETTAGTTLPAMNGQTYNGVSTKCLSCHDGSVAVGDVAWFFEQQHSGANAINTFKMGDDGEPFVMTGGGVAGSGDLAGNHPIGVPYPYQNVVNTYNGNPTGSAAILTEWQADPSSISNVRLFHDTGTEKVAGASTGITGIECSSCHDPHNKQAVADMFLRGQLVGATQASGYLCLQCHVK